MVPAATISSPLHIKQQVVAYQYCLRCADSTRVNAPTFGYRRSYMPYGKENVGVHGGTFLFSLAIFLSEIKIIFAVMFLGAIREYALFSGSYVRWHPQQRGLDLLER